MRRLVSSFLFIAVAVLTACTATNQSPHRQAAVKSNFKNVQVLPRDLSREQLIAIMRTFTRGLGVRCNHCHVVTATTPKEELDFASDAKEEKRVARVMIQMTQQINGAWMERVEQAEGHAATASPAAWADQRVSCWTCHRGKAEPELPPPPPPEAPR